MTFSVQDKVKVKDGSELFNELTEDGGWDKDEVRSAIYCVVSVTEDSGGTLVEARCSELTTSRGLDGYAIGYASNFAAV